jgi:hypothetical protein
VYCDGSSKHQKSSHFFFGSEIQCVNMDDDWEVLIRRKQKEDRANNPKMRYSDQVLQSSEPDWEMGDE